MSFEPLETRIVLSAAPIHVPHASQLTSDNDPIGRGQLVAEAAQNRWIAVLKPDVDVDSFARELRGKGHDVDQEFSHAVRGVAFRGDKLLNDPRVAHIEPDLVLHALAQTLPMGVNRINAELSPFAKIDGLDERVNVDIAILDTGIDTTHPDLYLYAGRNFTGGSETDYDDRNGHGTHVAGTAAALDNGVGVVGISPGARLWAGKVLGDDGSGYLSHIIAGVDWVTANADKIEVANLSLGGTGLSSTLRTAVQNSVAAGVVYVVAAGNSSVDVYGPDRTFGTSDDGLLASYPEVMTVSAFADSNGKAGGGGSTTSYGSDDSFASFSNYSTNVVSGNPVTSPGAAIDLLMPGVNILSTYKDGQYAYSSGTSMAAPHAAGLAALFVSANGRDLDRDGDRDARDVYAVRQALINGAVGQNTINGLASLNDPDGKLESIGWAESIKAPDYAPSVSVTSPANGATVSGTVLVSASASDDRGVSKVEFFVGQTRIGTDIDGSNGWSISWDSKSVNDATYSLTAVATDTAGQTASHSVSVSVDNVDLAPSVTITNPASGTKVAGTITVSANATDDKRVTQVVFYVGATKIGNDTDGSNGWSVAWNTTAFANGSQTLKAVATDSAGQTNSHSVSVTVDNKIGSANDMYVWDILWAEQRVSSSRTDLYVTVDVNRDTDADAKAESGDGALASATVSLILAHDTDRDGVFEPGSGDYYWTLQSQTNSSGQLKARLASAPSGSYMARVYGLTHSTAIWNKYLDRESPDYYYGLPGGSETMTLSLAASTTSGSQQQPLPNTRTSRLAPAPLVQPSLDELALALAAARRANGEPPNSPSAAKANQVVEFEIGPNRLFAAQVDELFAQLDHSL